MWWVFRKGQRKNCAWSLPDIIKILSEDMACPACPKKAEKKDVVVLARCHGLLFEVKQKPNTTAVGEMHRARKNWVN